MAKVKRSVLKSDNGLQVSKSDFLALLDLLDTGSVSKDTGPIGYDTYVFRSKSIMAGNGHYYVQVPFVSNVEGAVKASELKSIVKKFPDEEISLSSDGKKLMLICKGTTLKMNFLSEDVSKFTQILDIDTYDRTSFVSVGEDFINGLTNCIRTVARDENLGVLGGVCIASNSMVSTDNYCISKYTGKFPLKKPQILPAETAILIAKFSDLDGVNCIDNWIHFTTEKGVVASSILMKGDFPVKETDQYFADFGKSSKHYEFPEDVLQSLELVKVLSTKEEGIKPEIVSVKKVGDELVYEGSRDCGTVVHRTPVTTNFPDDFEFRVGVPLINVLTYTKKFQLSKDSKLALFENGKLQCLMTTFVKQRD